MGHNKPSLLEQMKALEESLAALRLDPTVPRWWVLGHQERAGCFTLEMVDGPYYNHPEAADALRNMPTGEGIEFAIADIRFPSFYVSARPQGDADAKS